MGIGQTNNMENGYDEVLDEDEQELIYFHFEAFDTDIHCFVFDIYRLTV